MQNSYNSFAWQRCSYEKSNFAKVMKGQKTFKMGLSLQISGTTSSSNFENFKFWSVTFKKRLSH